MKKLMITTALLATLTAVHAQEGRPSKSEMDPAVKEQKQAERIADRTESMIKELGLSQEQATKVRAMNATLGENMRSVKNADLSEEDRKAKMKTLREGYKTELASVLTPEQQKQLKQMREEDRAERKENMDPAKMEARADERADRLTEEMTKDLGLSADQRTKVEAINGSYAASMAKLQQAGLDESARKERMKAMRQDRDKELKAVLTPEQFSTMMELRKQKHTESKGGYPDMKKPHNE